MTMSPRPIGWKQRKKGVKKIHREEWMISIFNYEAENMNEFITLFAEHSLIHSHMSYSLN
jgi:hypothetical protein